MASEIEYMHLRARSAKDPTVSVGGLTLAARRFGRGSYRVGVALCSPSDNYSREKGRTIAAGRLGFWENRILGAGSNIPGPMTMQIDAAQVDARSLHDDPLAVRHVIDAVATKMDRRTGAQVPRWWDEFLRELVFPC